MKPRTRNEKEVARLSHSLSFRQSDWDWIEKKHTIGKTEYFALFECKGDWQVIRMFMYRSYSKKNEIFHEPLRYWIKKDGSYLIECKNRQCLGNYCIDPWVVSSELTLRKSGGRDVRDLYSNHTRIISLLPELKRTKFYANNIMVNNLMPFWLVQSLLTNNRVETFFKLRLKWLTWKFYHYDRLTENLWQSIRVALRHGYHWDSQREINDWCDMLRDLEYLGKDTRNPHYICPAVLSEAHQYWIEKAQQKRDWERIERERQEVEKYEPTFLKNRKMFFGMLFTDGEINIEIIPSAMAIKEEGRKMHHCVGGYYNKPNSLILSAKVDGERIETIEVNLKNYRLVQSRGLCNKQTEYHERIVQLVNDNMNEIRKRNRKHKTKKAA